MHDRRAHERAPLHVDGEPTPGGLDQPARRPDESMSLLTDLYRATIDDEYRAAAERRGTIPGTSAADVGAPMRVSGLRQPAVVLSIGVLIIGVLLATTIIQQRRGAPVLAAERLSLVERIDAVAARAAALRAEVQTADEELAAVQDAELQTTVRGEQVSAELDTLAWLTGATAVTGPGLVVVLDDAPAGAVPPDDTSLGEGRIQDIDLQQLVNGLWEAGAEAISVDGTRVGSRSAIRAAGDALFMDLQPLSPPYEVVAVGDPDSLGSRFLDTYGAGWLQVLASAYGIQYDVESESSVEVPGVAGADLVWARSIEEQST